MRNFHLLLKARQKAGYIICVGLDPDITNPKFSNKLHFDECESVYEFCQRVIRQTHERALAFKANWSFFLSLVGKNGTAGAGLEVLRRVIKFANEIAPEIPFIVDCKVGDIGNSNNPTATLLYDILGADAITVHNYMGRIDGMQPFLDRSEKGVIVLCRTSNKGGAEFQDFTGTVFFDKRTDIPYSSLRHAELELGFVLQEQFRYVDRMPMYEYVARRISRAWNSNSNCYLVVGATAPEELRKVREIVGEMPLLIPGIGAQGANEIEMIDAGISLDGNGMIVNVSRELIFADKPREKFNELHNRLTGLRIQAILARNDAVLINSHFVYTSKKHGPAYINMRVMAPDAEFISHIGTLMADEVRLSHMFCEVIIGPETLGRTLATQVGIELGKPAIWCGMRGEGEDKEAFFDPKLNFERLVEGNEFMVVDDLLTTGSSVKSVIKLIESLGGHVTIVAVAARRSHDVTASTLDVPVLINIVDVDGFALYTPEECQEHGPCSQQVPMQLRPGHGHEWIRDNPTYPVLGRDNSQT